MKKCPMPRCTTGILDRQICCKYHWFGLPGDVRQRLSDLFNDYRHERISFSTLQAEQLLALNEVYGEGIDAIFRQVPRLLCKPCNASTIFARDEIGGRVMLEEVTAAANGMIANDNDLYVVIGFIARQANGYPPIYTRFRPHVCGGKNANRPTHANGEVH